MGIQQRPRTEEAWGIMVLLKRATLCFVIMAVSAHCKALRDGGNVEALRDAADLSSRDDKLPLIGESVGESARTQADATSATLLTTKVDSEVVTAVSAGGAATGTCGDGKREGNEECDDGNTAANDGCNAVCKVEGGYQCLPLQVNGKDMCVACADTQCTTFFSRQSRCLNTASSVKASVAVSSKPKRTGAQPEQAPQKALGLLADAFIQVGSGAVGAYTRGPTGFCGMPIAGTTPTEFHCTPTHANMIRNNVTGLCECRGEIAGTSSTDPSKAIMPQAAACQILP